MKNILAIDPGPETSGIVILKLEAFPPSIKMSMRDAKLDDIRSFISETDIDTVICEWLTSYGSAVGASVLNTARIVGRIEEKAFDNKCKFFLMNRPEVSMELCQKRGAKKPQISEAIREIYQKSGLAIGGGKDPCKGTKKMPGPLFGISMSAHEGSALAVGIACIRSEIERWSL